MHENMSEHPGDDADPTAGAPPVNDRGRHYDPDAPDDERTYAVFMHLSLLAHLAISFLALIVPVIMWIVKKDGSPFLDDHGREAINFQLTLLIYMILMIPIGLLSCGVGFVVVPLAVYVLALIGMIQASMAANRGEFYRYPMTIRLLS